MSNTGGHNAASPSIHWWFEFAKKKGNCNTRLSISPISQSRRRNVFWWRVFEVKYFEYTLSPGHAGKGCREAASKHLIWTAELCRVPQFDGISLWVTHTREAPNVGIRFRVFDLNSRRS